jgi:hypothetical protein
MLNGKNIELDKMSNRKKGRMGRNFDWKTLKIKNLDIVEWKKRQMGQNVKYIED